MRYTAILILAFATAAAAQTQTTEPLKPTGSPTSSSTKPQTAEYDFVQVGPQKDSTSHTPEKPRDVLAVPWCKVPGKCNLVAGRWTDTTIDYLSSFWLSNKDAKILIVEDYEVIKTHEVCATVVGKFYLGESSSRYAVNFHGQRTSAEFIFTVRDAAESLAQRYCTPESLTTMINGTATTKRDY